MLEKVISSKLTAKTYCMNNAITMEKSESITKLAARLATFESRVENLKKHGS